MPLPSPGDYSDAVQSPNIVFSDNELKNSRPETNQWGVPKPYSGNFTTTFCLINSSHKWAVRCFTREIPDLKKRYEAISRFLQKHQEKFFVDVTYLEKGVRISGQWYPVIKMQWIDGDTLNDFIDKNIANNGIINKLISNFVEISKRIEELNMAHGDLQHGNIVVKNGEPYLIDYDGLYLPEISQLKSNEIGHPNYQHPSRNVQNQNVKIDRFSMIVIYLGLKAISIKPELWKKYNNGENILFNKKDFVNPDVSPLLSELGRINELKPLVDKFKQLCKQDIKNIPALVDFIGDGKNGQNIKSTPKMSVNANTSTSTNTQSGGIPSWEEKNFSAQDFQTFGDFLKKVIPEGQILKSLKINSKDVPIAFIDELKSATVDENITIEIELANAVQFLKETLNDVLGYIEHVKSLLPQVSDNLLSNNEAGWKAIKDLSEGISAMENLKSSTQQITKLTEKELNLVARPSEVMDILNALLSALDVQDNLEVSDIIKSKVPIVLDYYIEYFSKTLELIKSSQIN